MEKDYGDAKQTRSPEPPPSTGDQPMQGAPQESGVGEGRREREEGARLEVRVQRKGGPKPGILVQLPE